MPKKYKFSIDMKITDEGLDTIRLAKEWEKRFRDHVLPNVPYMAADHMRKYLQAKLPKDKVYKNYRTGLEVARVKGTGPGQSAYAVQVGSGASKKDIKVKQVLLEVRIKKSRLAPPDPATVILQRYSPWTYETLPFTPNPKVGYVVTKIATARAVKKVQAKQHRDRHKVQRELTRIGQRQTDRNQKLQIDSTVRKAPDYAQDALKLEFGLGGTKPKPSWRLGVSQLVRQGIKSFAKDKKRIIAPMTSLRDRSWKKGAQKTKTQISVAQAKRYSSFQKKLGIHI